MGRRNVSVEQFGHSAPTSCGFLTPLDMGAVLVWNM